ncbi:cupredoxin domain-containing protein [Candidatus Daviesbacteria bacterium]|nr:cupredoxin domain-containing protein [Candidatus Daviesbacteria bacterium]
MGRLRRFGFVFLFGLICYSIFFSKAVLSSEEATILLKDGEFKPDEITIKKGQEVIFKNEDTDARWPASDFHPIHLIYKEFDPKRPIQPGEVWKFKFEKAGIFKFHDHLNPHLIGKITVSESGSTQFTPSKDNTKKFNLTSLINDIKAYLARIYYVIFPKKLYAKLQTTDAYRLAQDERQLKYWLIVLGGNQLMDKLVLDTDGGSKVDCHQEAHLIGRTAYKTYKSAVFKKINYSCHSGFIHGAMEAFIAQQKALSKGLQREKTLMKRVENLCNKFKTDFSKFECLHGIGHGLTAYINYDIPKAINLCYQLSNDYAKRSCFGGVFMENIMVAEGRGAVKGHKTEWVSSDPQFPCNSVDQSELVQFECYQMQTSRMLSIFNYNFQAIAAECQRTPANMMGVCFRSLGRDIAGQTLRDPDKIIQFCQVSPPWYFQECITGGLNVIVDFWGETMTNQPQTFCNKLASSRDKTHCFQVLSQRLKDIFGNNNTKIEQLCQSADSGFSQTCQSSLYKN